MEIMIFLYNVTLLIIFGSICALSFVCYQKQKHNLYLVIGLLFFIYICDNTIIYMTEFIDWFSMKYNAQFMTVPAFKTISFISQSVCTLYICNMALKRKPSPFQYTILLTQGIILMFVPMMQDSAYKVWLYYLPSQIYLFWLSMYGLRVIRDNPLEYSSTHFNTIKKLLHISAVFAVLILIEDTIVIFNFDTITQLIIRINNRNVCEDILTIVYSFFAYKTLFEALGAPPLAPDEPENADPVPAVMSAQAEIPKAVPAPPGMTDPLAMADLHMELIDRFCDHYDLTTREQEIFSYLIMDKSNQEICSELCISIGTVKAHIHNIFVKIDATKRSQVLRAYKEFCRGLADHESSL